MPSAYWCLKRLTGQPSGVDTNLILEHLKAVLRESLTPVFDVDNTQLAPTYIEDEELRNLYQISTSEHLEKLESEVGASATIPR